MESVDLSCRCADVDRLRSPATQRAPATNCGRRRSSWRDWFGVAAIVLVGPRLCVAAGRGDPHDTGRVPARLVRERLRQIGEKVDFRDRLGAVRDSGLDGAAKADFDVRLVLDAQVQGAFVVTRGCLSCATRLFRTTQLMTSKSSVMSTSAPERTRMLAGPMARGPPTRNTI